MKVRKVVGAAEDRQSSAENVLKNMGTGQGNFVRSEVYNPSSGPLEIVNDDSKRILALGPYERKEISAPDLLILEKSAHFMGLKERNLVRLL